MCDGRVIRESTKCTRRKEAEAYLARRVASARGEHTLDEQFATVLRMLDELPPKEQDAKRHGLAEQLMSKLKSQLEIDAAWATWLKNPKRGDPGPTTLKHYSTRWTAFTTWLRQQHQDLRYLHQVDLKIAEEYAADLWAAHVSPSTFNLHIQLLRNVFRVLARQAGLGTNVWAEIPHKQLRPESRRDLKPDELTSVVQSAKGSLRGMFAVGLYAGMRLGDVCLLGWNDIDFGQGHIRHTPLKTKRLGKVVTIPLHPVLEAILRELQNIQAKQDEYVFPHEADLYRRDSAAVTKMIQRHFEACGIQTTEPPAGAHRKTSIVRVGFHSLRHEHPALSRSWRN